MSSSELLHCQVGESCFSLIRKFFHVIPLRSLLACVFRKADLALLSSSLPEQSKCKPHTHVLQIVEDFRLIRGILEDIAILNSELTLNFLFEQVEVQSLVALRRASGSHLLPSMTYEIFEPDFAHFLDCHALSSLQK